MDTAAAKKILIICYSLSGQTSNLLAGLANGLKSAGVSVTIERLRPVKPLRFPFGSVRATVLMMMLTFCRKRIPIALLSDKCKDRYDLMILAGRSPERSPFLGRYYPRYGHEKKQMEEARRFGVMLGQALIEGRELACRDFRTPLAICRGGG